MDLLTEKARKKNYPLHSVSISLEKIPYIIPLVIILKKSILQNYKIIKLI
jgi:hypothetical protein